MKLHCWLFLLKLSMKWDAFLQNFSLPFKNQRGTFFRPCLQSSANNRTVMPTYETTCSMRCKLLFLHSTVDKIPLSRAQAMNRNLMENKTTIHISSTSTDLFVIKLPLSILVNTNTVQVQFHLEHNLYYNINMYCIPNIAVVE